jgi:hypothetical protein
MNADHTTPLTADAIAARYKWGEEWLHDLARGAEDPDCKRTSEIAFLILECRRLGEENERLRAENARLAEAEQDGGNH